MLLQLIAYTVKNLNTDVGQAPPRTETLIASAKPVRPKASTAASGHETNTQGERQKKRQAGKQKLSSTPGVCMSIFHVVALLLRVSRLTYSDL
jgi:hypothetical protein